MQIFLQLPGLNIKHVDEDLILEDITVESGRTKTPLFHLDISENVVALRGEVVLHEGLLTPAVPEVEDEVAQQPHVRVLHVYGGSQPSGVPSYEVGEDDGPHARLTRARLSHQQNLLTIHDFCK